jgi:hypothetical protein
MASQGQSGQGGPWPAYNSIDVRFVHDCGDGDAKGPPDMSGDVSDDDQDDPQEEFELDLDGQLTTRLVPKRWITLSSPELGGNILIQTKNIPWNYSWLRASLEVILFSKLSRLAHDHMRRPLGFL